MASDEQAQKEDDGFVKKASQKAAKRVDSFTEGEPGSIFWVIRGIISTGILVIEMINERLRIGRNQKERKREIAEEAALLEATGRLADDVDYDQIYDPAMAEQEIMKGKDE